MRAVCEACGRAQPLDWKAGDLCTSCGQAVRREVRCYWCVRWTPFVRFCRGCGAELVEESRFGAARMLKDAGVDRFSIARRLTELAAQDVEQLDNLSRLYQRHAALLARHVDALRFVEGHLVGTRGVRDWSGALEDARLPQLPWPEETLRSLEAAAPGAPASGGALPTLKLLSETSPFPLTQDLATLARLRWGDLGVLPRALELLRTDDRALAGEAALALASWHVLSSMRRGRDLDARLVEALQGDELPPLEACVGLGLLGQLDRDKLSEALTTSELDLWFPAALALGDEDRLRAALRLSAETVAAQSRGPVELLRALAGKRLVALGATRPVVDALPTAAPSEQLAWVEALLGIKGPIPEAGEALLSIVEHTSDATLRERAARLLCRSLRPDWALRLARAAQGERYIFQSLLSEAAALPPEALGEVAAFWVDEGLFSMTQYGLEEAGRRGALADDFVPRHFARAREEKQEETQKELLRFAESQLEARGDEALHRFMLNVVYGPYPAATRSAAWWVLHRWYRRSDVRGEGPLTLEPKAVERFFGSVQAFAPHLAAVLRDPATLKEVGVFEHLAHLLGSATEHGAAFTATLETGDDGTALAHELVRALLEAVRGDYWPQLREAMMKLLAVLGNHPRWRDEAIAGLEAVDLPGNYYRNAALEALRSQSRPRSSGSGD